MPWSLIDRTYRIGHAVLWEQILAEVESWELDSDERLDLLRVVSHFLFHYADEVTGSLADVHQAERDRQIRGRERRRIAWVREVLAEVSTSSTGGDYELGRQHLAAVAWGPEAEGAITDLGRRLDATVLVVPGQSETTWGWLGAHAIVPTWLDVTRELPLPPDTFLALGAPASGSDGFRLSHRQALEAARVLRRTGSRSGCYDGVALEALLLRDERAALDFARRELGPLLEDGRRTRVLLETLRTYVRSGWNAASAAAQLGVHERTVGYRLATIEQRLGRPLSARRQELGAALRLTETLG
jgi:DNA-binding PucR family transcriptional regulator